MPQTLEARITPSIIHDVRNVLASMISVSDLVKEDIENENMNKEEAIELLSAVSESSSSFLLLLEELLNVSSISNLSQNKVLVNGTVANQI